MSLHLSIEVTFQGIQVLGPELPIRLEPVRERFERLGLEAVDALLSRAAARDEARLSQHLEVLGDRRLADRERVDELTHAARGPDELTQDLTPRRLGEDGEDIHTQLYALQRTCLQEHLRAVARGAAHNGRDICFQPALPLAQVAPACCPIRQ
jgi:hypothetical protein